MGTRVFATAAAVVCLLIASRASAQGLDGERFQPATGVAGGFELEHPAVPFHLGWGLGLFLNGADDPVVSQAANGAVLARPVSTAGTANLLGSIGLFGRVELGVDLPIHFIYEGDPYVTGGATLSASPGLGDLRFVPKVALVRTGSLERHVLLSLAMPIALPSGNDLAFRGDGGVSLQPELLFALHAGRLAFLLDGGYRYRSQHPATLAWGDEITFGGGLAYGLSDHLTARGELFGAKEVNAAVAGADLPLEALVGIDYAVHDWDFYAGVSKGITDGIGDPDVRIIVGVRLRKHAEPREGFLDSDGDGILDKDDRCPNEAEDYDGFQDHDGCPEPDNDHDGIPDADDECPEIAGDQAHRGCPAHTYVKIENGQIIIFGKVQFRSGSAEIDHNSDQLLDQIGQALSANPQVKHVRIEGHTDNVGDRGINQKLSEARAQSVKAALEKRNIDGERLRTRGFGETRPIAPNGSPGGRHKNRRVEFFLE
jgi:outer membrane protein OmpA-like peptidoglycan-associated protein